MNKVRSLTEVNETETHEHQLKGKLRREEREMGIRNRPDLV